MIPVMVIGTDLSVVDEKVPGQGAAQREALRRLACAGREEGELSSPDRYHDDVLTWVHTVNARLEDDERWGQVLCRPNVLGSALASAWTGRDLGPRSYWLHGPVVLSGAYGSADALGLPPERAAEARAAQGAYAALLERWRRGAPPVEMAEQWQQVLEAVRSVVPPARG